MGEEPDQLLNANVHLISQAIFCCESIIHELLDLL